MTYLGFGPRPGAASAYGDDVVRNWNPNDNALGSTATLYALNNYESIPTVTYNGIAYTTFNLFDTGSNSLAVSDPPLSAFPIAPTAPSIAQAQPSLFRVFNLRDTTVGSGTVSAEHRQCRTVGHRNPNFAVFNDSVEMVAPARLTDLMDFGLPFFLGNTIFVGIGGQPVPSGVTPTLPMGSSRSSLHRVGARSDSLYGSDMPLPTFTRFSIDQALWPEVCGTRDGGINPSSYRVQ